MLAALAGTLSVKNEASFRADQVVPCRTRVRKVVLAASGTGAVYVLPVAPLSVSVSTCTPKRRSALVGDWFMT